MFEHKVFNNTRVLKIYSFKKCTCLPISNWSKFQIIIDIYIYTHNVNDVRIKVVA